MHAYVQYKKNSIKFYCIQLFQSTWDELQQVTEN